MDLKALIFASSLLCSSLSFAQDELSAPTPVDAPPPPAATASPPRTPAAEPIVGAEQARGSFALRASFLSGIPDFAGASVSVMALKGFELEVGGSYAVLFASLYLRGGPRFDLVSRTADTGWSLALPVLLGYRASSFGSGFNVVAGLDSTWWMARHFGFTLQLTAGAIYRGYITPDLRLAAGVAF